MLHFDFVVSYFCVTKSDLGKKEFLWACSSGAWACVSAQRPGRSGWSRRLRDHIFNHRHEAKKVNQNTLNASPWWHTSSSRALPPAPTPKSAAKRGSIVQVHEPVGDSFHSNRHSWFYLLVVLGTGFHVIQASLEHAAVLPLTSPPPTSKITDVPLTSQLVRLQMCTPTPHYLLILQTKSSSDNCG